MKSQTGANYVYAPISDEKPGQISERFLSEDERVQIADLLCAGHSLRSIARELGRNASTISRELHRNRNPTSGAYQPFQVQRRAGPGLGSRQPRPGGGGRAWRCGAAGPGPAT
ncbi:helix-turn-helix domain-containing protein, partial [Streptomyces anulatus]|uniref:helix-turn-helix domain-containing protein n=1 Tax=Streptomyces anulatus TaxID=1892 RepID=UPI00367A757A